MKCEMTIMVYLALAACPTAGVSQIPRVVSVADGLEGIVTRLGVQGSLYCLHVSDTGVVDFLDHGVVVSGDEENPGDWIRMGLLSHHLVVDALCERFTQRLDVATGMIVNGRPLVFRDLMGGWRAFPSCYDVHGASLCSAADLLRCCEMVESTGYEVVSIGNGGGELRLLEEWLLKRGEPGWDAIIMSGLAECVPGIMVHNGRGGSVVEGKTPRGRPVLTSRTGMRNRAAPRAMDLLMSEKDFRRWWCWHMQATRTRMQLELRGWLTLAEIGGSDYELELGSGACSVSAITDVDSGESLLCVGASLMCARDIWYAVTGKDRNNCRASVPAKKRTYEAPTHEGRTEGFEPGTWESQGADAVQVILGDGPPRLVLRGKDLERMGSVTGSRGLWAQFRVSPDAWVVLVMPRARDAGKAALQAVISDYVWGQRSSPMAVDLHFKTH